MIVAEHILDSIGKTPLLKLNKITADKDLEIWCKLEYYNPTGSLKDRIYKKMIEEAEKRGELKPGMTILEASTGNAGISAAFIGAVKGYKVIVCMPGGMSEERKKTMRAYGAELIFTPGGESDVDLVIQKVREMKEKEPGKYWEPAQFDNPDNWRA
ncbi:pyridoxal-phosphate dependent enzyme, partial [Candidatus Sumerlaeota bacterium]|nr:pyridoxal-phosphate dependent enzyme [Candidatus Sumerlaeota bacterium]